MFAVDFKKDRFYGVDDFGMIVIFDLEQAPGKLLLKQVDIRPVSRAGGRQRPIPVKVRDLDFLRRGLRVVAYDFLRVSQKNR